MAWKPTGDPNAVRALAALPGRDRVVERLSCLPIVVGALDVIWPRRFSGMGTYTTDYPEVDRRTSAEMGWNTE